MSENTEVYAEDCYAWTQQQARFPLATFPVVCPWEMAQLLADDFWPEEHRDRP